MNLPQEQTINVGSQETEYSKGRFVDRFPLISWLTVFFCFMIFPVFLINVAFRNYFHLERFQALEKAQARMKSTLEKLSAASDGQMFFHGLLNRTFRKFADQSPPSHDRLKQVKDRLNRLFPGTFRFIFWESRGKPIKDLSDEKGFRYLQEKLHQLLSDLGETPFDQLSLLSQNRPMNDRLNQLRSFLGPFVPLTELVRSLLLPPIGRLVVCQGYGDKAFLWFGHYPSFSVLVFVDRQAGASLIGAYRLIKKMGGGDGFRAFIYDSTTQSTHPRLPPQAAREVRLNFQKFLNLFPEHLLESERYFYIFHQISHSHYAVARLTKESLPNPIRKQFKVFGLAMAFFTLGWWCFFYFRPFPLDSLRIKLFALFSLVLLFPILVLATMAMDYLNQKENDLFTEKRLQHIELLKQCDRGFATFLNTQAHAISRCLKPFNPLFPASAPLEIAPLLTRRFSCKGQFLFDHKGQDLFERKFIRSGVRNASLIKELAMGYLQYQNPERALTPFRFSKVTEVSIDSMERDRGQLKVFHLGTEQFYSYMNFLPVQSSPIPVCLFLFWEQSFLVQRYYSRVLRSFQRRFPGLSLHVYYSPLGHFISKADNRIPLLSFLQKAERFTTHFDSDIHLDDNRHIFVGISGRFADRVIFALSYPHSVIHQDLKQLRWGLLFLIAAVAVFCTGLYTFLLNIILQPLSEVTTGLAKVRAQEFDYRIPLNQENEFGDLATAINHTLEHLKEIKIAQAVQENLFPGNTLSFPPFELFGKTLPMTKLGGDYYDFFEIEPGKWVIIMGDVSGHGVPAAILMAMTKSTLVQARLEKRSLPESILFLNTLFMNLKKAKIPAMLTCQFLLFDMPGREIRLFNCGHCTPIRISQGKSAEFLPKLKALPLGYRMKQPTGQEITWAEGEVMVLYSDGVIESRNQNREMFGENRFLQLLEGATDDDLERMYNKILHGYEMWRDKQDDDISLILIKKRSLRGPSGEVLST
jgi:hypothetical protein